MDPLSFRRGLVFAAMGAVLWLAVALLLRAFAAAEMTAGLWRYVLYVLAVPTGLLTLWLFGLAGARRGQRFVAISIGTMVALMLDGLAFGWAHGLYSSDPARTVDSAGVILWGAGLGMLLALWADRRI